MSKKKCKTLVATLTLAGSLGFASTEASEVTIPHTFSAGTAARASEVNANFSAVKAAVDDNAQDITGLRSDVDALQSAGPGGLLITVDGTVVGAGPIDDAYYELPDSTSSYTAYSLALNRAGYYLGISLGMAFGSGFTLDEGVLMITDISYDQANCTGSKYLSFGPRPPIFFLRQGIVIGATDPSDSVKAYVAKGTPTSVTLRSVQTRSSSNTSVCTNLGVPTAEEAVALAPNDPAVTGVPNNLTGPVALIARY